MRSAGRPGRVGDARYGREHLRDLHKGAGLNAAKLPDGHAVGGRADGREVAPVRRNGKIPNVVLPVRNGGLVAPLTGTLRAPHANPAPLETSKQQPAGRAELQGVAVAFVDLRDDERVGAVRGASIPDGDLVSQTGGKPSAVR